jgi:hypothetical protein
MMWEDNINMVVTETDCEGGNVLSWLRICPFVGVDVTDIQR